MAQPNPFDVNAWVTSSSWEFVEDTPEYQAALHLVTRVQDLFSWFAERPRYSSLYDQLTRNSQSVLHNLSEAFGKGRGYYSSALLIARGEAFECCASISICPAEIRDELKPIAVEVTKLLSARLKTAPQKPS